MTTNFEIPNWKKEYEIGIPEIDFQHQYFIRLVDRFYRKKGGGLSDHMIVKFLNEIILYTQFHFCSEENLMELHGYPEIEPHKRLHINIIQDLNYKINLYEINKVGLDEITNFLVDWFLNHTVDQDFRLAEYINKR